MRTEGTGLRPPAPVPIKFSRSDFAFLREQAIRRRNFRGYAKRADAWGRGFISDPVFVGMCGEQACCAYLNRRLGTDLKVDTVLRYKGDGGVDIMVFGMRLQVKTRAIGSRNLVRRVTEEKKVVPIPVHAFVFAQLLESEGKVNLLGWLPATEATEHGRQVKSGKANFWNLEVDAKFLEPMKDLAEHLNLRRTE